MSKIDALHDYLTSKGETGLGTKEEFNKWLSTDKGLSDFYDIASTSYSSALGEKDWFLGTMKKDITKTQVSKLPSKVKETFYPEKASVVERELRGVNEVAPSAPYDVSAQGDEETLSKEQADMMKFTMERAKQSAGTQYREIKPVESLTQREVFRDVVGLDDKQEVKPYAYTNNFDVAIEKAQQSQQWLDPDFEAKKKAAENADKGYFESYYQGLWNTSKGMLSGIGYAIGNTLNNLSGKSLDDNPFFIAGLERMKKNIDEGFESVPNNFGGKTGAFMPMIAAGVASILQPEIAPYVLGAFSTMGFGEGMNEYEKQKERAGEPVDELAKNGVGALYAAIYGLPLGSVFNKVAGKTILPKIITSAFTKNYKATEKLGAEIMKDFIKKEPGLAKQFAKSIVDSSVHGVLTMEGIALGKTAVDTWLIGKEFDPEQFWASIEESAVSGLMFGATLGTFARFKQLHDKQGMINSDTNVLYFTRDAKNEPIQILGEKNGKMMGVTADGVPVEVTHEMADKSFSISSKQFREAVDSFKKTKEIDTLSDRDYFSGVLTARLNRIATQDNTIYISDGLDPAIITGRNKKGNYVGIKGDMSIVELSPDIALKRANAADVHDYVMQQYDKMTTGWRPAESVQNKLGEMINPNEEVYQVVKTKDGKEINITGGKIAFKADGTVDVAKSDKVFYYKDAEGKTQMAPVDSIIKRVVQSDVETLVNEAVSEKMSVNDQMDRYKQGTKIVLLESGIPKATDGKLETTTVESVDESGITFRTAEGQEIKASFEEADGMVAPLIENVNFMPGMRFLMDGYEISIKNAEEGDFMVDVVENGAIVETQVLSPDDLQRVLLKANEVFVPQETQQPVETEQAPVEQAPVEEVPVSKYPVDKNGKVDYKQITDPQLFTEAIKEEFTGNEVKVVQSFIDQNAKELAELDKIKDPAERARTEMDLMSQKVVLNDVMSNLSPMVKNKFGLDFGTARQISDGIQAKVKTEIVLHENTENFKSDVLAVTEEQFKQMTEDAINTGAVAGIYVGGRVFIDFSNMDSVADLELTLLHELIHPSTKIEASQYTPIIREIQNGAMLAYLDPVYFGESNEVKVKETIAAAAESLLDYNTIEDVLEGRADLSPIMEGVRELLRNALNNLTNGKYPSTVREEPISVQSDTGATETIQDTTPAKPKRERAAKGTTTKQLTLIQRANQLGEYLNLEDFLLRTIGGGDVKFFWNDRGSIKGLASELGLVGDRKEWLLRKMSYLDEANGVSVNEYANAVFGDYIAENKGVIPGVEGMTDMEVRDAILDVLLRHSNRGEMIKSAEQINRGQSQDEIWRYEETPEETALLDQIPDEIFEQIAGLREISEESLQQLDNIKLGLYEEVKDRIELERQAAFEAAGSQGGVDISKVIAEPGWRDNIIKARKYAIDLGIDFKGKGLEQLTSEIDALVPLEDYHDAQTRQIEKNINDLEVSIESRRKDIGKKENELNMSNKLDLGFEKDPGLLFDLETQISKNLIQEAVEKIRNEVKRMEIELERAKKSLKGKLEDNKNQLKIDENAIKEGDKPKSNLSERKEGDGKRETAKTSGGDRAFEGSKEKILKPVFGDRPVVVPDILNSPELQNKLEQLKKRLEGDKPAFRIKSVEGKLDFETTLLGASIAKELINAGVYKFEDFATIMASQIGNSVIPHLKAFYELARTTEGVYSAPMTSKKDVEFFDIYTINTKNVQDNVRNQSGAGQRDSQDAEISTQGNVGDVLDGQPTGGQIPGEYYDGLQGSGGSAGGSNLFPPVYGESSDIQIPSTEQTFPSEEPNARDIESNGSWLDGAKRPESISGADGHGNQLDNQIGKTFAEQSKLRRDAQKKVKDLESKLLDEDNIREQLPVLLEDQVRDVIKAENRLFNDKDPVYAEGKGIMFTNGTGTGKTFVGLGIIKRFVNSGKQNIIIITPNQDINMKWTQDAKLFDVPITILEDTKDRGKGVVVTTFANFSQNEAVMTREFDLIIYDESHRIMEEQSGAITSRFTTHLKLANIGEHNALRRLIENQPAWKELQNLYEQKNKAIEDGDNAKSTELDNKINVLRPKVDAIKQTLRKPAEEAAKRTKVVFLSATPFKGHFNLKYADGVLFDMSKDPSVSPGAYQSVDTQFMLANFGAQYEWKYNRLQKRSDANMLAVANQEINFNEKLQKAGVLSARAIEIPVDYSREFVVVTGLNSELFNRALADINDFTSANFPGLRYGARKVFHNYNYSTSLFESLKASMIVERVQEHLDMGRKVPVYHRRVSSRGLDSFGKEFDEIMEKCITIGLDDPNIIRAIQIQTEFAQKYEGYGTLPPFETILTFAEIDGSIKLATATSGQLDEELLTKAGNILTQVNEFRVKYKDLLEYEQGLDYRTAPTILKEKFGDRAEVINGTVPKKKRETIIERFNKDDSGVDIVIIQEEAGKEGISLHDTTGKKPRVMQLLSMPISSTTAIQVEGRIYRVGGESNAVYEYILLGLDSEVEHYGRNLNRRLSTTENLSMGNQARDLLRAFSEGVLNSHSLTPSQVTGIGGKELDRRMADELSEFRKAVYIYEGNQKVRGKRDQREGVDYFATPEPVGQKMVEFLDIQANENVLEPSAGHGAIAMWFPKESNATVIEPSFSLFSKLRARSGGGDVNAINDMFENHNVINKYDGIVMNPPFGQAGKIAMEHVEKAFNHLRTGGRLVALVPRGAMDMKIDKFLYGKDDKGNLLTPNAFLVAEINLPVVTFQQAGTKVSTRIIVIEKLHPGRPLRDILNEISAQEQFKAFKGLPSMTKSEIVEVAKRIQVEEKTSKSEPTRKYDLTYAKDINELFDGIENFSVPERMIKPEAETAKEVVSERNQVVPLNYNTFLQKHTKTGKDMFMVNLNRMVDYDIYRQLENIAKGYGGYYSKAYKKLTKAGFSFDSLESRNDFINEINPIIIDFNTKEAAKPMFRFIKKPMVTRLSKAELEWHANGYNNRMDYTLVTREKYFNRKEGFQILGGDVAGAMHISSSTDVATLFRRLQSAETESAYAVLINKDRTFKVIVLSHGSRRDVEIDTKALYAAVNEFNPAEVVTVHNHPGGSLRPSRSDIKSFRNLSSMLRDTGVKHEYGVIIDTDSGYYTSFNRGMVETLKTKSPEMEIKPEVYQFDAANLYLPEVDRKLIDSSHDVAKYISNIKRGTSPKVGVMILDKEGRIARYQLYPSDIMPEIVKEIKATGAKSGDHAIIHTNFPVSDAEISKIVGSLRSSVPVLDVLEHGVEDDINASFRSWMSQGQVAEPVDVMYGDTSVERPLFKVKGRTEAREFTPKPKLKDFGGDKMSYAMAVQRWNNEKAGIMKDVHMEYLDQMNKPILDIVNAMADEDIHLKRTQNFVVAYGGEVGETEDAYSAKNRSFGRQSHKQAVFLENTMKPFVEAFRNAVAIKDLKTFDVTLTSNLGEKVKADKLRKVTLYLQAKDIVDSAEMGWVERGELGFIQTVGITPEDYISQVESLLGSTMVDTIWKAVRSVNKFGLDQQLEAGRITKSEYDKYMSREYYVPQRGWEEHNFESGKEMIKHFVTSDSFEYPSSSNPILIRAKGRQTLASDPLAYMQSIAMSSIVSAERNIYKQNALNLVTKNIAIGEESGAFGMTPAYYVNTGNVIDGVIEWEEVFERPDQALYDEDAKTMKAIKELTKSMRKAIKEGEMNVATDLADKITELEYKINVHYRGNREYTRFKLSRWSQAQRVEVYKDGQKYVMWFADTNVSNSLNGVGFSFNSKWLNNAMGASHKATQWYAAMNTRYNPAFALWNMIRDFGAGVITLPADAGFKATGNFMKNYSNPVVHAEMMRYSATHKFANTKIGNLLKEYFESGSATGFSYMRDFESMALQIAKEIKNSELQNALKSNYNLLNLKAFANAVSVFTEYSELITRFSTFVAARESGISVEKAADLAKNVSVNFNHKGKYTPMFNSLIAFFGASTQGSMKWMRFAKKTPGYFGSLAALLLALGFINTLLSPNGPEEKRNWSEFDRIQNFILGNVKIPLPQGIRALFGIGVYMALAARNEMEWEEALFKSTRNLTGEFSPVNPVELLKWNNDEDVIDGLSYRPILPTMLQPLLYDVAQNERFTGTAIHPEAFGNDLMKSRVPEYFMPSKNVNKFALYLSKKGFELSGGDANIKDMYLPDGSRVYVFNVNPSDLEYLFTSYTGGVGRFINDTYKFTDKIISDGEVDFTLAPIANRALKGYNEEKIIYSKLYELKRKVDTFKESKKTRDKSFVVDGKVYDKSVNDFMLMLTSDHERISYSFDVIFKTVEDLVDARDQIILANGDEKKVKEINNQIKAFIKEIDTLNKEWDKESDRIGEKMK